MPVLQRGVARPEVRQHHVSRPRVVGEAPGEEAVRDAGEHLHGEIKTRFLPEKQRSLKQNSCCVVFVAAAVAVVFAAVAEVVVDVRKKIIFLEPMPTLSLNHRC